MSVLSSVGVLASRAPSVFSGYLAVARMSFREFTAYKVDVVIQFLTYPVVFLASYFFLAGTHSEGLGHTGFSQAQLLTYYSMGWLLRMINHHGADMFMSGTILSGDISSDLIKPLDYHAALLARSAGKVAARVMYYALPAFVLLTLVVKQFLIPLDATLPAFLVFTLLGLLVAFEVQYLVGCLAFYITINFQIAWIVDMFVRLASGLIVPLSLLPAWIKGGLEGLPFPYIYFVPIQVWLGKIETSQYLPLLGKGLLWLLVLHGLNRMLFRHARRHIAVFGG